MSEQPRSHEQPAPTNPPPPSASSSRIILEAMTELVASHELVRDASGEPIDYRLLDCNGAWERNLGLSRQNAIGRLASEVYGRDPETGLPPYLAEYTAVAESVEPASFETFYAAAGKHYAISIVSPGPGLFVTVTADVTERHRAAEALRAEKERLAVTLRSIGDAVVATDATGRVTEMNLVAEALTGYSAGEAVGRPLAEVFRIVNEETRAPALNPVDRVLAEGVVVGLANHTALVARDGCERPIADSAAPIRGASGSVEGVVLVFRDQTHEKELQAQLMQSDRLASVGLLAAGVAHEVNNPLAYLLASLAFAEGELARVKERCPAFCLEEAAAALADARDGAERVRHVVSDLKTFSRASDEASAELDVAGVLDAAVNMAWTELKYRARVVREYAEVPLVRANESRLGQVFLNLLVNASQAMEKGRSQTNEVRLAIGLAPGGEVMVEVRDTGCGIPKAVLPRIFDPFFTTKGAGAGTGLGLSICRNIVRGLGGSISVESEQGRGATFRILLPPGPPAPSAHPSPPPASAHVAPTGRRGRVLAVDDEAAIGVSIRRILRADHDVEVVTDARVALARLTAGEPFDVVLCDLMMPGMTGMELHAALNAQRPEVLSRMVFLTGGAFTPEASEFLGRVPNARLDKPFDAATLRALVRALLG